MEPSLHSANPMSTANLQIANHQHKNKPARVAPSGFVSDDQMVSSRSRSKVPYTSADCKPADCRWVANIAAGYSSASNTA